MDIENTGPNNCEKCNELTENCKCEKESGGCCQNGEKEKMDSDSKNESCCGGGGGSSCCQTK